MKIVINVSCGRFDLSDDAIKYISHQMSKTPQELKQKITSDISLRWNKYLLDYIQIFGIKKAMTSHSHLEVVEIPDEYFEAQAFEILSSNGAESIRLNEDWLRIYRAKNVIVEMEDMYHDPKIRDLIKKLRSALM